MQAVDGPGDEGLVAAIDRVANARSAERSRGEADVRSNVNLRGEPWNAGQRVAQDLIRGEPTDVTGQWSLGGFFCFPLTGRAFWWRRRGRR